MDQFTKHEIVIGKKNGNVVERPLVSGHAFLNAGDGHYSLKLFMFPNQTYYMVKNRNSSTKYTIFAKQVSDERGTRFQNPVGLAQLPDQSMYVEIYLPILRTQMFMSIFPAAF